MTSAHQPHPPSQAELRRAGQVITLGTWTLITAVCTFSAMTGAHFIGAHTPWPWSGWILATGIDSAFVMALQTDATLARYGTAPGPWPTTFRWTTGLCSLFVNTGDAALHHDSVGIAIHLIAPTLLLTLGEAAPSWRRRLSTLEYLAKSSEPSVANDCFGLTRTSLPGAHQPAEREHHPPEAEDRPLPEQAPTASAAPTANPTGSPVRTDSTVRPAVVTAAGTQSSAAECEVPTPGAHSAATSGTRALPANGVEPKVATVNTEHAAHTAEHPSRVLSDVPAAPANAREARSRIVQGRLNGLSQRETARLAHRSPTYVRKVWTSVEGQHRQPAAPQTPDRLSLSRQSAPDS
ncbi:hypothetical protein OG455_34670 [Kitasatospora sp. NBC_01287]|uniref:hypothetical protein n=1 Tax=Kitasatospora sp. NBC_01287 TaxID=2903573 RepID=UPI0022579B07|nr:hypothetical protein [Kitasatospora sp. NBC_01287]MCX4750594.1 hypothetical protein [Kitasatospora sp. NBC_01287]